MPVMVGLFAAMNALFISAIALGTSANAILLQNTAPFFVYLVAFRELRKLAEAAIRPRAVRVSGRIVGYPDKKADCFRIAG